MAFVCQQISKEFVTQNQRIEALHDVTFSVRGGEFVCIVGPSGCGKTTLLKIIAGLISPTRGRVQPSPNPNAMVFQDQGLFPWMNVLDNVAFGLEMRGVPRGTRNPLAQSFIEGMGLGSFSKNYPHELSVGMRQRVGIARAFVTDPPLLLMDEPFASLDAQTKRVMQEQLLTLWRDHRKSVVYVTHDIEEAILLGDRVMVMTGRPGRILAEIPVPLSRPRQLDDIDRSEIQELKSHIWKMLEPQVRENLTLSE